jgi:hypothetical protein
MPKPAKPTRKKKTSKQTDADRAADARRYQRDKPKRIAAVKEQQDKDPDFPAKRRARAKVNNAVRDGRMAKPSPDSDFHHSEISTDKDKKAKPKGRWVKRSTHRRLPLKKDAKVKR